MTYSPLISFRSIALVLVILIGMSPLSVHAATKKPTCVLTIATGGEEVVVRDKGKIFVQSGNELRISWESKNAITATNGDGDSLLLSGTEVHFPSTTSTYSYQFNAGNTKVLCRVTAYVGEGSIDASSLQSRSTKPTLSGTVSGTKTVQIQIRKEGSTKILSTSKVIKVKNGVWKAKISKKLPNGTYDVTLRGEKGVLLNTITTGVLTIDTSAKKTASSATTLSVKSVPLLFGGVAKAGTSAPVSYLQITNTGKENATVKGFWIKQNGSAPAQSVIGLSTVDDTGILRESVGGTEGSTPFTKNVAFAPTNAVFLPGQMRLFTIKALITANTSSYRGKQLSIDVTAVDGNASIKGVFPIKGTTWTIQ